MADKIETKVKVKTPDGNIVARGASIHCEPLICTFCGKHICPGTQKIYFQLPFLGSKQTEVELCSVKCIKEYYAGDDWTPEKIKVLQDKE